MRSWGCIWGSPQGCLVAVQGMLRLLVPCALLSRWLCNPCPLRASVSPSEKAAHTACSALLLGALWGPGG